MAHCIHTILRCASRRSLQRTVKASLAGLQFIVNRNFGSAGSADSASASYKQGLVLLSLPLPSRNELCEFTLRPVTHSVKDLVQFIKDEDGGVERAAIYNSDGIRVSHSTPIDILMQNDFKIIINENEYEVVPPKGEELATGSQDQLSQIRNLIERLHTELHVQQYQEKREDEIKRMLEHLQSELTPLEESKMVLDEKAARRTNLLVWGGLAYMAVQFGFLARLTWWEYSWDIMEPVTYFVTYGASIAMYAYFVLTRGEYTYDYARDREHLVRFHKEAEARKFNLAKYNGIKESMAKLQSEMTFLKSAQLRLPSRTDVAEQSN